MADPIVDDEKTEDTETVTPPTVEELQAQIEELKTAKAKADDQKRKANKEAETLRVRQKAIDDAAAEAKDKDVPESEKARRTAKEALEAAAEDRRARINLEQTIIDMTIDREIEREAASKFWGPHLVPKLVDRSSIEYDPETRKVTGVKGAIDKLLKENPDLGRTKTGGGTPPREEVRGQNGKSRQEVKEVDPIAELYKTGNYY